MLTTAIRESVNFDCMTVLFDILFVNCFTTPKKMCNALCNIHILWYRSSIQVLMSKFNLSVNFLLKLLLFDG